MSPTGVGSSAGNPPHSKVAYVRRRAVVLAAVTALVAAVCERDAESVLRRGSDSGIGDAPLDGRIALIPEPQRQRSVSMNGDTLDGAELSLSDYRGRALVVNFWASWCLPCRKETPELVASAKALAARDVELIGVVSKDHGKPQAQAFTRRFELPYPSLWDPDGSMMLGIRPRPIGLPTTLVLDRQHRVAAMVSAPITRTTLLDLVTDAVPVLVTPA
ncbi:TlpA disulfide reductase family protein [Actinopolymorpha pittospori]|nr:TlpA disulfide reductase family protein [Actinopolymorpha pittospori]